MIHGDVTGPDGVTLPGVRVILRSPMLVFPQKTTATNVNGVYRFPGLAPGNYELTFELEVMDSVVQSGVKVRIGKITTVNVRFTSKDVEENIPISGKKVQVKHRYALGMTTFDKTYLNALPVINRNFLDFFDFAPGVINKFAHGGGEMNNVYQLDGVLLNDPATGAEWVGIRPDII